MLTQELLKSYFLYDENTGNLIWKVSRGKAKVGNVAGCKKLRGNTRYVDVRLLGKYYLAHRLIWLYVTGENLLPEVQLDHIDGNGLNNKIENLRKCPHGYNMQNKRSAMKNNKTGYLGVSFWSKSQKYVAEIVVEGRRIYLGSFDDPKVAHDVYVDAKRRYHVFGTL